MALCPGLPGWAGTRKVKPIWILLKQETVSGNGISWAICKPAPRSRQITMPAPHRSVFLQAGCPSCRPTNSVKALKAVRKYMRVNTCGCFTCACRNWCEEYNCNIVSTTKHDLCDIQTSATAWQHGDRTYETLPAVPRRPGLMYERWVDRSSALRV